MLEPVIYRTIDVEKEFNRFEQAAIRESDKYDQLLTFLTSGAFIVSTSIVSLFSVYHPKDNQDLFFLKVAWCFLIISFLCSIVNLGLARDFSKEYSDILAAKTMNTVLDHIEITNEDIKKCNSLGKRCDGWMNAQIIFFLIGIGLLLFFFMF